MKPFMSKRLSQNPIENFNIILTLFIVIFGISMISLVFQDKYTMDKMPYTGMVVFDVMDSNECNKSLIGTNFINNGRSGPQILFTDVLKQSDEWVVCLDGPYWTCGDSMGVPIPDVPLDDVTGYPLHVPFSSGGTSFGVRTYAMGHSSYPSGDYTFIVEGTGTVHVKTDSVNSNFAAPGVYTVHVNDPTQLLTINILSSDVNDPVRNMHFIMPGFEDSYETDLFYPLFLERLGNISTLRMMKLEHIDEGNPTTSWESRTTPDYHTQSTDKGVALEYLIALANTLHKDVWLNIPEKATDDYISNFAVMVRDNLDPDLMVYIEYSNEIWNPGYGFPQGTWIMNAGCEMHLNYDADDGGDCYNYDCATPDKPTCDSDKWPSKRAYWAMRMTDVFEIFDDVFSSASDKDRLVKVIAGQAGYIDLSRQVLDATYTDYIWNGAQNVAINPDDVRADAYASAPYFGENVQTDARAAEILAMGKDAYLDWVRDVNIPYMIDVMKDNKALADSYNLTYITYEGGQHFLDMSPSKSVLNFLISINRDPRMYDLYTQYFQGWFDNVGNLFVHFNYVFNPSQYGFWGSLESLDQNFDTAYKYQALMEMANTYITSGSDNTDCANADILCVDDTPGNTQEYSTIQDCASAVTAGQTCLVYPGAYHEQVTVNSKSDVVFKSVEQYGAVVIGDSVRDYGFRLTNCNHVTIDGFYLKNFTKTILNAAGIYVSNGGSYLEIMNNKITDVYYHENPWPEDEWAWADDQHGNGIFFYQSGSYSKIHDNLIMDTTNSGIRVVSVSNGVTEGIEVYNNNVSYANIGFRFSAGDNYGVLRNVSLHDNNFFGFGSYVYDEELGSAFPWHRDGVHLFPGGSRNGNYLEDIRIYNNFFTDDTDVTRDGGSTGWIFGEGDIRNSVIYNNILHKCNGGICIWIQVQNDGGNFNISNNVIYGISPFDDNAQALYIAQTPGVKLYNNIIIGTTRAYNIVGSLSMAGFEADNNILYSPGNTNDVAKLDGVSYSLSGLKAAGYDTDSFNVLPDFAGDPETYYSDPAVFKLAGGSVGIDAGTDVGVLYDILGNLRDANPDIGAYEYTGAVITPVCGNDVLENGEECDDGNLVDGDGCDSGCMIEPLCIDSDSDGWNTTAECNDGVDYDCDDSDPDVNPDAVEICNSIDDDCDDIIDEVRSTDPNNCGSCGNVCNLANVDVHECLSGTCGIVSCDPGWTDLNNDTVDGCESACTLNGSEICNGIDDDCDSDTSDGIDEIWYGQSCGINGIYICQDSIQVCDDPGLSIQDIGNITLEYGDHLGYDLNSSNDSLVDCYSINDTQNFKINCSGYLENNTALNISLYWLNIGFNDSLGNITSMIIWVNITSEETPAVPPVVEDPAPVVGNTGGGGGGGGGIPRLQVEDENDSVEENIVDIESPIQIDMEAPEPSESVLENGLQDIVDEHLADEDDSQPFLSPTGLIIFWDKNKARILNPNNYIFAMVMIFFIVTISYIKRRR